METRAAGSRVGGDHSLTNSAQTTELIPWQRSTHTRQNNKNRPKAKKKSKRGKTPPKNSIYKGRDIAGVEETV